MIIRSAALLVLLGCGSSSDSASAGTQTTQTTTGDEAEGPCPTELSECYDEGSRAECLEVAETCANDQIAVLESCPVQYACETQSEPSPGEPVASDECAGYSRSDSCINDENFAECQRLETECPGSIVAMESCPLQFACE